MALYELTVGELVNRRKRYVVEADSPGEARLKAVHGDTVKEEGIREDGVVQRVPYTEPKEIPE